MRPLECHKSHVKKNNYSVVSASLCFLRTGFRKQPSGYELAQNQQQRSHIFEIKGV